MPGNPPSQSTASLANTEFAKRHSRFSMRFLDPEFEQEFLRAYRHDAAGIFQWGVLLAGFLALAFMWHDTSVSESGNRAINIRRYLVMPLCALTWFAIPGSLRSRRARISRSRDRQT